MRNHWLACLGASALLLAACSTAPNRPSSTGGATGGGTAGTTADGTGGGTTAAGTTTEAGGDTAGGTTEAGGTPSGGTTGAETVSCSPGEVGCDGVAIVACQADGKAWYTVETCSGGKTCEAGNCVQGCQVNCTGKTCGDDGCGGTCGACVEGQTCSAGGSCVTTPTGGGGDCPAAGTGIQIGQQAKNMTWNDGDGNPQELHSYCGTAPGILIMETATW